MGITKHCFIVGLYWLSVIFVAIMIVSAICTKYANAADHAIVSFDSPEHLAALQDSVVGVRDVVTKTDTISIYSDDKKGVRPHYFGWDEFSIIRIDTVEAFWAYRIFYEVYRPTITCRRLVCVVKTEDPGFGPTGQHKWGIYPGQAIIFYEPYKEEQ